MPSTPEYVADKIRNPGPAWWPYPEFVTPDMEGPAPFSLLPCGCHQRRPDYEAVLCDEHLDELNCAALVPSHAP